MYANIIRTILTWGAIVITVATSVFGCTAAGDCSASWLPPAYAGYLTVGFLALNQFMKAFQGGGFGAGLVSKTVVVSPTGEAGTVTQKQVDTTTTGEKK